MIDQDESSLNKNSRNLIPQDMQEASQKEQIGAEKPITNSNNDSVPFHYPYNNPIKHIYVEQENVYGRYNVYLLLKDQLKSEVDSSGATALNHMCSHNSPYLPLYLSTIKDGDPILNKPTKLGHHPLDVAGMYCKKQYVDLLKQKGAIDDGKVDHWSIQGANLDNWSGKVDPNKTPLIHWAAYNNLPEVLLEFSKHGVEMDGPDGNGNTPIDMAMANKSYKSIYTLAELGCRPKKNLIQNSQSKALKKYFSQIDNKNHKIKQKIEKTLKLCFIPVLLILNFVLVEQTLSNSLLYKSLLVLSLLLWLFLSFYKARQSNSVERKTKFSSSLINGEVNYKNNHFLFIIMNFSFIATNFSLLSHLVVDSHWMALIFWFICFSVVFMSIKLGILVYGILINMTPHEMFYTHEHKQFWKKIDYLTFSNMLCRVFKNPYEEDPFTNIGQYFKWG